MLTSRRVIFNYIQLYLALHFSNLLVVDIVKSSRACIFAPDKRAF
jgi:hypothetical protein